jgi:tRNA(Glu) U13 pseudouridine synthase TruD
MFPTTGAVAAMEAEALASFGVTPADLAAAAPRFGQEHQGHRRPLRVPLSYPSVQAGGDEHGHFIQCDFELPPGAFATVVMDEVMKNAAASDAAIGPAEGPAPSGDE